jgi:hypothetical protein
MIATWPFLIHPHVAQHAHLDQRIPSFAGDYPVSRHRHDLGNAERLPQGLPLESPTKRCSPSKTRSDTYVSSCAFTDIETFLPPLPVIWASLRSCRSILLEERESELLLVLSPYDATSDQIMIGVRHTRGPPCHRRSQQDLEDALQLFLPLDEQGHDL